MKVETKKQQIAPSRVIYDAECRFCVWAKGGLEQRCQGRHVTFIPYQSKEAAQLLGEDHQAGPPTMMFLVDPNGHVTRGIEAVIPLASHVPGGDLLTSLWKIRLFRPVLSGLYAVVARYRYRWFGSVQKASSSSDAGEQT